ncbi:MAG: phosphoribosylamine--glycine ligase N-terminal domain-containing protein, partial [Pseudomonadota bacterium]|nr:phosphoribosylamine--glycine ligase N-terminal domain-containing protein [Pseudomonadota bacterium]
MNVMILGAGGREHALTWKISQSDDVDKIFVLPGNYGISKEKKVTIVNSKSYQNKDYLNFAIQNNVELVVVGPEEPLVNGIVDIFEEYGIKIFGPNKNSAMLEGSKEFCK